ncbi:MAG: transglutaminase domain-containing protein [Theionarchaea archaeon]|nr:transglutaminase domain-containing protein [Theionarchaea archaeon]MBU7000718.1 transglutaminase domain-containing protein [Theionarchaea archaeon]MBU7021499.1 transglutaminase domain-containing protein [Theionarchaea archaeon]MBU7033562.1 transglutaminase domain-containing protein [Theionarchaea archaeon]MBU7039630.1 transglutaminase domain-containing protein [Theionarchaea archaeon]
MPLRSNIKKSLAISAIGVVFVIGMGGNINPLEWKTQVDRFFSPQQLILPGATADLYDEMEENVKDDPAQVFSVIEWKVQYATDLFNYRALNHLATAEEVLRRGRDDCDGQAVVLCSVLRYAGYDAVAVIGPYHSWVEVKGNPHTMINYKEGTWFVRFNEMSVQWNYWVFFLVLAGEFLLFFVGLIVVFHIAETGLPHYVSESMEYLKYMGILASALVLTVFVMSRYWVPGLMVCSLALLIGLEIIAQVRTLVGSRRELQNLLSVARKL